MTAANHAAAFAYADWCDQPLLLMPGRANALVIAAADPGMRGLRPFAAAGGAGLGDDGYSTINGVATIPVRDVLGTDSYRRIQNALRRAGDDAQIKGIVLDIDSPGGAAAGAVETADVAREVSTAKPVVAYVNSLAGSAAYVVAAGAPEIVATPSGTLGSIGVAWLHLDCSAALASQGVKPTLLFAGAYKTDGNFLKPLDPEARARIGEQIAGIYSLIVESVGKHRPKLGIAGARKTDAAVYFGAKAVEAGLADRIDSLDDVLRSLQSARVAARMDGLPLASLTAASPAVRQVLDAGAGDQANAAGRSAAEDILEPLARLREALPVAQGNADGQRAMDILASPAAKGREKLARHIALNTSLSLEEAVEMLSTCGIESDPKPAHFIDRVQVQLCHDSLDERPYIIRDAAAGQTLGEFGDVKSALDFADKLIKRARH